MTGTFIKRFGYPRWTPDFHTQHVMDTSTSLQAVINAMAVQCPECQRPMGNSCVLPDGLTHMGIFVHHQRIARGGRS